MSNSSHPHQHNQHGQPSQSQASSSLQDGFQDVLTFRGHRLQLRGFNIIESLEDPRRQTKFSQNQHYISWDVKQVLLWGFDPHDPSCKINIVNQVKFSNQPNYICAIVHVNKMKVFLAAALDMSFKLFDNHLNLLESIHHEERAILQLEYDPQKELVFSSGATGISAWRLYRNTALDKAHIMEKLFSFHGCDSWITNMIYQPQSHRIFAIKENNVQVLSTTRRAVVTSLENCHEAPINVACWYERNQFYLTGCSRGEIKCWTSNYTQEDGKKGPSNHLHQNQAFGHSHPSASSGGEKNYALLHVFKGHLKGVTAIHLHPVSGLAITAGLDGFMKVLNLEALNELFSIHVGSGILGMRIVKLPQNHHGCLVSLADATIKLWKITSVCDFFAVASSKIAKVDTFENLEAELEYHYKMRRPETREAKKELSVIEHLVLANSGVNVENMMAVAKPAEAAASPEHHPLSSLHDQDILINGGYLSDKILITQSNQDLRAFTHKGVLLGRLEPEHLIDGIKGLCVSVYQKLLFCLCEGSRVRVFDLKRFNFPLLYEFSLRNPSIPSYKSSALMEAIKARKGDNSQTAAGTTAGYTVKGEMSQTSKDVVDDSKHPLDDGSHSMHDGMKDTETVDEIEEDIGVCCTLIDIAPASILRAPKFSNATQGHDGHHLPSKFDVRGEKIGHYIESFLLLGLSTGSIVFLDVLNQFEVIMNFQAINGIVLDLKYRRRYRELIMYGKDYSQLYTTVKIWKLPEMELIGEYGDMRRINCFAVSNSLNFFAVGTTDGVIRLFSNHIEDKVIQEVTQPGEGHDATISSICFLDDMRVFCTCSTDGKVKFWDFEKRLVRSIQLNIPTCSVVQNGGVGDVVMAQNHYLLTIPKRIWNEDDVLGQMRLIQRHEEELNRKQPLRLEGDDGEEETNSTNNQDEEGNKEQQAAGLKARLADPGDAESNRGKGLDVSPSRKPSIQERKASRRFSKLSVSNQSSQSNMSVSNLRKPSLSRKMSSVKALSQASSSASLRSEDDISVGGTHRQPGSHGMTMEEIEKEILLPALKSKQYQYIDRDGSVSPPRRPEPFIAAPPHRLNNTNNMEETFQHSQEVSGGQDSSYADQQGSIFPSDSIQLEMQRYHTDIDRAVRHEVIDTLHPRFLIHKKAPARAIQLEDIQEHVSRYMQMSGMNGRNTIRKSTVNPAASQAAAAPTNNKANPHFGLSPRARLTLISSRPQSKQSNKEGKDKGQDDDALVTKTQEKLIMDLTLGMQVSNEYKQQRAALNQERQQRDTVYQQRSTFIVQPAIISPSKEAPAEYVEVKGKRTNRRKNLRHGTLHDADSNNNDAVQSGSTSPTTEGTSVQSDPDTSPSPMMSPGPTVDSLKRASLMPTMLSIDTDGHAAFAPFSPAAFNLMTPAQPQQLAANNEEIAARRKPLKPSFLPPPININV